MILALLQAGLTDASTPRQRQQVRAVLGQDFNLIASQGAVTIPPLHHRQRMEDVPCHLHGSHCSLPSLDRTSGIVTMAQRVCVARLAARASFRIMGCPVIVCPGTCDAWHQGLSLC